MSLILRTATAQDCGRLAEIDHICNPHPWTSTHFQAALNQPYQSVWLAEHSGSIVGLIVWETLFDTSELHLIDTLPEMQRQGIATALMTQWFQAAPNVKTRILEVRADNFAAQQLYRKYGFNASGIRRAYYANRDGSRTDALLMEQKC